MQTDVGKRKPYNSQFDSMYIWLGQKMLKNEMQGKFCSTECQNIHETVLSSILIEKAIGFNNKSCL